MSTKLKKILTIGASTLLLMSSATPAMARTRHHRHYRHIRTHRVYRHRGRARKHYRHHRRHRRKRCRRRRHRKHRRHRRIHYNSKNNYRRRFKSADGQIYQGTLRNLNRDRRQHGEKPFRINHHLNGVATARAKQIAYSFHHHLPSYELKLHHVKYRKWSENISEISLLDGNGTFDANEINNDSMYYDGLHNNGHRHNILNRNYNQVGVGVIRHHSNVYLAIEFIRS